MTEQDHQTLLALHLAGQPTEEWCAMLTDGSLRTYEVNTLGGWERRLRIFKTPAEVRVGQPVLLRIRPHGEHCGCDPGNGVTTVGKSSNRTGSAG